MKHLSSSLFGKITAYLLLLTVVISALSFTSCGKEHKHQWGEWKPYIESTCYIAGQERSVCSCGAERFRALSLAHEYKFEKYDVENGEKIFICTKCHGENSEELTSDELGIPILSLGFSTAQNADKSTAVFVLEDGAEKISGLAKSVGQTVSETDKTKKDYSFTFEAEEGEAAGAFSSGAGYKLEYGAYGYSEAISFAARQIYGSTAGRRIDRKDADCINTVLYVNGKYAGLYKLSQDGEAPVISSGDGAPQTVLYAGADTPAARLSEPMAGGLEDSGFRVVYGSASSDAAAQSFNDAISFTALNNGAALRDGLAGYIDTAAALDGMLFVYAAEAVDCVNSGIYWVTDDGKVWAPVPADFSAAFGRKGNDKIAPGAVNPGVSYNVLWDKFNAFYAAEVAERWAALRAATFTVDAVEGALREYYGKIPPVILEYDDAANKAVSEALTVSIPETVQTVSANLYQLDVLFGLQ